MKANLPCPGARDCLFAALLLLAPSAPAAESTPLAAPTSPAPAAKPLDMEAGTIEL